MPVLPRVVRRASVAAVLCVVLCVLAGCSRFDAALGQRQAVVSFRAGTTTAERLQIRAACASLPGVAAQRVPDLKKYPYALQQLTYSITNASNAQFVNLDKCLQKFPAVISVSVQDSSDDGG
ncbi:MAG TPA: hypothetical protein VFB06_17225 [Streptosporangiaceae bacterium]|nr:hypothetical protein [Streptosporangiaceae bacterium]